MWEIIKKIAFFFFNISPSLVSSLYSHGSDKQFKVKPKDNSADRQFWRSRQGVLLVASTTYLLFGCLRQITCSAVFAYGPEPFSWYLRHDPFAWSALFTIKLVNRMTAIAGPPFLLFLIYLDYLVNVRRFNNVWASAYESVVLNGKHFLALNQSRLPKVVLDIRQPINSLKGLSTFIRWFWQSKKADTKAIQFAVPNFKLVGLSPHLSARTRLQVLLFSSLLQGLVGVIVFLVVLLVLLIGGTYLCLLVVPNVQTALGAIVLATDCIFFYYLTIHYSAILLTLVHVFLVGQLEVHFHVQMMEAALKKEVLKRKQVNSFTSYQQMHSYGHYLLQIAGEHCSILPIMILVNREVVSPLMLFAGGANFLSNIYLLTSAYQLDHLDGANKALNLVIASTQFALCLLAISPSLAIVRDVYHFGGPFLEAVGLFKVPQNLDHPLSRRLLAIKLKLAAYTEIMVTDSPVCYTIGPYSITSNAVFEFTIFYTGYLLLMLQQLQDWY